MDTFNESFQKKSFHSINVTVKCGKTYLKMNIETNSTVKRFVNECCQSHKMKYWTHSGRCTKCFIKDNNKKPNFTQNIKEGKEEFYNPDDPD
jgi:hypothetical protein